MLQAAHNVAAATNAANAPKPPNPNPHAVPPPGPGGAPALISEHGLGRTSCSASTASPPVTRALTASSRRCTPTPRHVPGRPRRVPRRRRRPHIRRPGTPPADRKAGPRAADQSDARRTGGCGARAPARVRRSVQRRRLHQPELTRPTLPRAGRASIGTGMRRQDGARDADGSCDVVRLTCGSCAVRHHRRAAHLLSRVLGRVLFAILAGTLGVFAWWISTIYPYDFGLLVEIVVGCFLGISSIAVASAG